MTDIETDIRMRMSDRAAGKGWLPDFPDFHDYYLHEHFDMLPYEELDDDRDLSPFMAPARDQGTKGSCVGYAICSAVEYLRRTDDDKFSTIYSPLFAYYQARAEDDCIPWDVGAYIRDGIKGVVKVGVPPESRWPYIERRFAHKPSATAMRDAARWRLGKYYRCDRPERLPGDTQLTYILNALHRGFPVVGGFSCYTNMFTETVWRTGDIPMPRGSMAGGHAVCFSGYSKQQRRVFFKNSWGPEWGKGGYGSLPFDYVANGDLCDDFWALTLELDLARKQNLLSE